MRKFFKKFQIIIISVVFTCCSSDEKSILAKVNNSIITESLFESKYNQFLTNNYLSDNLLNRYALVNSMIDSLLILDYANKIGLKNEPRYLAEKNEIYHQLLLNKFFDSIINIDYDIDDSELRKFFIWKNTTFQIRHLFAYDEYQMDNIVKRLDYGEKWESIAKDIFQDPQLKNTGGNLGLVRLGDLEPVFEMAAFQLNKNQISDPIKTKNGYSIIQLLDKTPDGLLTEKKFELEKRNLSVIVEHYMQQIRLQEYMKKVETTLNITFHENSVIEIYNHYFSLSKMSDLDLSMELVEFDGNSWDVNEALNRLDQLSEKQLKKINSILDFKSVIKGLICRSQFIKEAKIEKIYSDRLFQNQLTMLNNKAILKNVLDKIYATIDKENPNYLDRKKTIYLNFRKNLFEENNIKVDSLMIKNMIIS